MTGNVYVINIPFKLDIIPQAELIINDISDEVYVILKHSLQQITLIINIKNHYPGVILYKCTSNGLSSTHKMLIWFILDPVIMLKKVCVLHTAKSW